MKIARTLATMGAPVITIRSEQSLEAAVTLLSLHAIGALVVVGQRDELVGMLSERDIVRTLAGHANSLSSRVAGVMTQASIAANPADDLKSVVQTMHEKKIHYLPVVDQGRLVGIISIRDLVETLLDEYTGVIDSLEVRLIANGASG